VKRCDVKTIKMGMARAGAEIRCEQPKKPELERHNFNVDTTTEPHSGARRKSRSCSMERAGRGPERKDETGANGMK